MSFTYHVAFDRKGAVDEKGSYLTGLAGPGVQAKLTTGPYIVQANGGVLFKARQMQHLIAGLRKLGETQVVAKPYGIGNPVAPFYARLQEWETAKRPARPFRLDSLRLLGSGTDPKSNLLVKRQRRHVLSLTTDKTTWGEPLGLVNGHGARVQGGATRISCSALAGVVAFVIGMPAADRKEMAARFGA